MKVIIDARTTQDEIKYNGVGRYSNWIIRYLITNNPNTKFILLMYDGFSTISSILNKKNVEVIRLGKYLEGGGLNLIRLNIDLVFHISLNKALKGLDLSNAVFFSPYFWRGLPVGKLPCVVVFHDFALPVFNIYSTISPIHNFLRKIHYWNEMKNVLKCDQVIVDAQFTYDDFITRFPTFERNRLSKILLGVEEDFGHSEFEKLLPSDWKDKKYLIYLGGGLTENKNSVGVLKGYKYFLDYLRNKKIDKFPYLVIAGKNFLDKFSKEADNFREEVKKLGIEKYVHFAGMYEDPDRWELVKHSFCFIHLSTFEGFGFAVAEAMRAKVPVIAHNGSTYPEVVGNGGLLVDGLSEKEVGEAILKVYSDTDFANKIAELGYKKSLEYDWNKTAEYTFNILRKASHD